MMDPDSPHPRDFALLAVVFEGAIVVAAVVLGWLLDYNPLSREWFYWDPPDVLWGLLATLPPLAMLWLCLKLPLRPLRELIRVVDELLLPMFKQLNLLELAVISLLAGLGEEMLFRVVLQQSIADSVGGLAGGCLGLGAAAVLFGLLHRITITYAVLAGLIGLYLGAVWIIAGNLLVPIMAHALYDFFALVYLAKLHHPAAATTNAPSNPAH